MARHRRSYWLMQIAMVLGLAATYPVQIWFIRRGIKERMGRSGGTRPREPFECDGGAAPRPPPR